MITDGTVYEWGEWYRGEPKAELRNGELPPWSRGGTSAVEVATAIFRRLPYQIIGDIKWSVIRNLKGNINQYVLSIQGGHSNIELHQKVELRHVHGMSINAEGTVSFTMGFDDRLHVEISLKATK